jgi:hypothetical protein
VGRSSLDAVIAAVEAQPPRKGLEAVAVLRKRLESLEATHVEKAIRAGWSWRQVANVLGVSKQAVHKKHAKRIAARLADGQPGERKKLVVTGRARLSVRLARAEAALLGAGELRPEHLLLGLLRDEGGAAAEALRAAGLTLGKARAAVDGLGDDEPAPRATGGRLPVSPAARAAMEESLRVAVRRGDSHLGVEHLLLSLLTAGDGGVPRLLAGLGVEARVLEERLEDALGAAV